MSSQIYGNQDLTDHFSHWPWGILGAQTAVTLDFICFMLTNDLVIVLQFWTTCHSIKPFGQFGKNLHILIKKYFLPVQIQLNNF